MVPDAWDWETPIDVVVAEDVGVQMPIDVSFAEYGLLERVARAQGMSPHAYVKQSALAAARAVAFDGDEVARSLADDRRSA